MLMVHTHRTLRGPFPNLTQAHRKPQNQESQVAKRKGLPQSRHPFSHPHPTPLRTQALCIRSFCGTCLSLALGTEYLRTKRTLTDLITILPYDTDSQPPKISHNSLQLWKKPFGMNKPVALLPNDKLEALQIQLLGVVSGENCDKLLVLGFQLARGFSSSIPVIFILLCLRESLSHVN